jgi:hypothetical protein
MVDLIPEGLNGWCQGRILIQEFVRNVCMASARVDDSDRDGGLNGGEFSVFTVRWMRMKRSGREGGLRECLRIFKILCRLT